MTLRMRLLSAVALAVLAGMALGCGLTVWQARRSISTELRAALAVGRQTVASARDGIAQSGDPDAALRRTIAAFDGNRHIRASLIGGDGSRLAASVVAPAEHAAPDWFGWTIGAAPAGTEIPLASVAPGIRAIRLDTDPRNEVAEVWRSFENTIVVIAALSLFASVLIGWAIARALRPLAAFSDALRSVGAGRFEARLSAGPLPEIRPIAEAFNRMAEDLATARQRNLALYRRLVTAQEAERAEIARDLHDDIGPLLFAINIDAAAIEQAAAAGDSAEASGAARSVRETVQQMRLRLRAIVNRLRPVGLADLGLADAIRSLAEFWQRLQPGLAFRLDLAEDGPALAEPCRTAAYRIVQEAVSNALRHGRPATITISVHAAPHEIVVAVSDDGAGAASIEPGFGLLGMEERAEAAGGSVQIEAAPGQGVTVTARLPVETEAATP